MSFTDLPERYILRTRVHQTNYTDAGQLILQAIQANNWGYVAIANVHMVMTGYWDQDFQAIINNALLTTPDGMPLVWGLKLFGLKNASRVYGPDLTLHCCAIAEQANLPIYFYGSRPETLAQLKQNLLTQFPQLQIVGMDAPPFRPLTEIEEKEAIAKITESGAKLIFVGLGCPKQERWMAQHTDQLPAILLGVGAAFDFHAGTISQAPRWLMNLGLEWLYRLVHEPKRLWQRYLLTNTSFVVLFLLQLLQGYRRGT